LEAAVPLKKRKVKMSPNSRFVTIEAIRRAKIEAGEIEAESVDEEGSEKSEIPESCIVVGFDDDAGDDEVEG
jgi:4-hydroxybenzoate polyprenyltransferase